ncbi:hypothetical protein CERZMDRAFT_97466 [Cercospora zeae-maydis SCOH1-5]|uniref:Helix-turn-helix domain-containing protein n=1 Tax=Cercospora zeae-maydis SCOH1-5 TaxID=717836 RepID=A0A6A6FFJ9_9PEZI|nr:hypothetical protein CERZMDRAFT_97466 [Cercospora zeae-maydis SCOH1-5]
MGSASSKAAKAAGSAARKYPARSPLASAATNTPAPPPNATTTNAAPQPRRPAAATQTPGPTVHPAPHASGNRNEAINLDASDPDFAQSLRNIGPVQPNPTLSPTSAFNQNSGAYQPDPRTNPAVLVLSARAELASRADAEIAETGIKGRENLREFLDVYTIRQILTFREQGRSSEAVEKHLGLKKGVVERLGPEGVFGLVQESGRAEKRVEMV